MNDNNLLKQELDELNNLEDVYEDIVTTSDLFSISSFGVDYPVETLVSRMRSGLFYIPDFQRQFVWSQNQSSRFVESLLLGLPVPGIFLFKEPETGRHLVIDGQQRLKSLLFFCDGLFKGREFCLTGLESEWEGQTHITLSDADRARLADAVIHATVFKQDLPQNDINSVYEVFERINTGGSKLSSQKIRSCICHGNFNDFLHRLNENEDWRAIFGQKSKRLRDVETILRFLAFYEDQDTYSSPMKHFLNDYMKRKRHDSDEQLVPLQNVFMSTMRFVSQTLGERPFRPDRALNVAVFDAVSTSIAHMLQGEQQPDAEDVERVYAELLENEQFKMGYTQATADEENVRRRFEEAKRAFGVS